MQHPKVKNTATLKMQEDFSEMFIYTILHSVKHQNIITFTGNSIAKIKTTRRSKTFKYQTTRRHIPED
jgi:hypothetical protein